MITLFVNYMYQAKDTYIHKDYQITTNKETELGLGPVYSNRAVERSLS